MGRISSVYISYESVSLLSWVARLPPQFLESIFFALLCSTLLSDFGNFSLHGPDWRCRKVQRMFMVGAKSSVITFSPFIPPLSGSPSASTSTRTDFRWTSRSGEGKTEGSKAATSLLFSFSSYVGGYLPFYLFASFCTLTYEVTRSMML